MNIRYFIVSLFLLIGIIACKQTANEHPTSVAIQDSLEPYAELRIREKVDLGLFNANNMEKSVGLELANVGTDTLYILGVLPDCDCTTLQLADSVIPPHSATVLTASLNLTEYLSGKTVKQFSILSNNKNNRVTRVTLIGTKE